MSDMENDVTLSADDPVATYLPSDSTPDDSQPKSRPPATEAEKELVKKIQRKIRSDKKHHKSAFERMERDMFIAMNGRTKDWSEKNYAANITGRHIKQKTASLYAKNPKAVARRRETLDYTVWDEKPQSLQMAFQTVMQAQQMLAMNPGADPSMIPPEMLQAFEMAQATVDDFQQGTERRQQIMKIGKTLEILFAQALR